MKRGLVFICVATIFININAQVIIPNDSATTSPENKDMTFYSLLTGQRTVVSNTDWHLAVSVRPSEFPSNTLQGTTLRINEAFGVKAYLIPGFTADSFFIPIDTVGFHIWQRLYDSDSILDAGAFNTGYNIGVFNYGWGVYTGAPSHDVVGNKIYLLQLPNNVIKKMWVEELDRDTAWNIQVADLNNANLQTIHVSKKAYEGRNFVYVNLVNYNIYDKEPLSANWDLQFLKYAATDVSQFITSPTVGVWVNKGRTIARREGVEVGSNDYSALTFSSAMNTIGWNWKSPINIQQYISGKNIISLDAYYTVEDSLTYFVQIPSQDIYKVIFTSYTGNSKGIIYFKKERLTNTAITETKEENSVSVFPNPANDMLNVKLNSPATNLKVFNINGSRIAEYTTSGDNFQFSTLEFANGVYLLAVTNTDGKKVSRKFVVNH